MLESHAIYLSSSNLLFSSFGFIAEFLGVALLLLTGSFGWGHCSALNNPCSTRRDGNSAQTTICPEGWHLKYTASIALHPFFEPDFVCIIIHMLGDAVIEVCPVKQHNEMNLLPYALSECGVSTRMSLQWHRYQRATFFTSIGVLKMSVLGLFLFRSST